jgi:hypothetical protein
MSEEKRRQWFESYVSRIEQGVKKPAQTGVLYLCPCCRYPTLSERGQYFICELCNWEDDGQDDPHADEAWGGPNGAYSLSEARANFQRYLIMYDPAEQQRRGVDSALERQAKQAIMTAFDAMVGEVDQEVVARLKQVVSENEAILRSELERKIREYEQSHRREHSSV